MGASPLKRAARYDTEQVRRGLLAMLLGAAYYFFASGYSAWDFPFAVPPMVTESFTLTLSLCGLGLVALDTLHSIAPAWSGAGA